MKTRIISALVLVIITIPCIFLSEISRVLIFGAAGFICAYEYRSRMKDKGIITTGWVMYLFLAMQIFLTITHSGLMSYMAWFTVCIFLALFSGVLHKDVSGQGALYTLAGLSYPCFPFAIATIICVSSRWKITISIGILSSVLSDTFALLGGMLFGKHKIAPDVSPKKTLEGCISGALSSVLTALIIFCLFRSSVPITYFQCLVASFCSAILGQIGDLSESLLKRYIGIKDFSNLIPGHGGMFDRVDSLMFALPTAYFCLYIMKL